MSALRITITKKTRNNTLLYPVVMAVPRQIRGLHGRQRTTALSRFARLSVHLSAKISGLGRIDCKKDAQGVPLPSGRVYWSVSHKPGMVCGVAAQRPVGIDIEKIKPVETGLFDKIVTPEEKKLFDNSTVRSRFQNHLVSVFFRAFTAKEAVLKENGIGIKGLGKICIEAVADDHQTMLRYCKRNYWVDHFYLDGHVASVTKEGCGICWMVSDEQGNMICQEETI